MRILFVDDEARVLDGLRRSLRAQRDRWRMTFALGGSAALEELERAPFDVIVSDMRMPEMDGLALLTLAKERWPGMTRIVLSGYMDTEVAVRSASVAHQFLAKPCEPAVLEEMIRRTRRLGDLLADVTLRAVVGEVGALATRPTVFAELERIIADPNAGLADARAIIERDVSLTAKVLQLVNSSFFGLPRRVGTVEHAVAYLGLNVLRALVLSHEIAAIADTRPMAVDFSLDEHQERALRVASLARRIVGGGAAADDAFLAGVLHDVGALLLATQRPEWHAEATALAVERGLPLHEAEAARFGVSHAEIGAYLVGLWGLPVTIVETIAFHHVPSRGGRTGVLDVLAAVHIADALVTEATVPGGVASAGSDAGGLESGYVTSLGLGTRLEAWRELAGGHGAAGA